MARIAGVDIPREKRVEIALTYIYGIGVTSSRRILSQTQIDPSTRVEALSEEEIGKLRSVVEGDFKVEDFLDESSDMAVSVNLINTRFGDEGEPAEILIEGDILDPRVFAAIDTARNNMNREMDGFGKGDLVA